VSDKPLTSINAEYLDAAYQQSRLFIDSDRMEEMMIERTSIGG